MFGYDNEDYGGTKKDPVSLKAFSTAELEILRQAVDRKHMEMLRRSHLNIEKLDDAFILVSKKRHEIEVELLSRIGLEAK